MYETRPGPSSVLAPERPDLAAASIRVHAEQTGGYEGRTVRLHVATGRTLVRSVRGVEVEL